MTMAMNEIGGLGGWDIWMHTQAYGTKTPRWFT